MGIFRAKPEPAFGHSVTAAAGGAGRPGPQYTYTVGAGVLRALSIPTISRARDLIVSMVSGLDLRAYTLEWDGERYQRSYVPGESWFTRPDPRVTRNFFMAAVTQDLIMHGRAFAYVVSRYSTGFPAAFQHLPYDNISTPDQAGPEWFGPAEEVLFNGVEMPIDNVVQFLSPVNGLLWQGERAIDIAYRLDEAAKRFASTEIAAGYLQQLDPSEPMTGDELTELASAWADARRSKSVGALNNAVEYREFKSNPSVLQLTEGRQYAARELARVANVPFWLVGVETGGMTYQNVQEARKDLYQFGAKPFIDAIQETFSLDSITARGKHVELDVSAYLIENAMSDVETIREVNPNA